MRKELEQTTQEIDKVKEALLARDQSVNMNAIPSETHKKQKLVFRLDSCMGSKVEVDCVEHQVNSLNSGRQCLNYKHNPNGMETKHVQPSIEKSNSRIFSDGISPVSILADSMSVVSPLGNRKYNLVRVGLDGECLLALSQQGCGGQFKVEKCT